MGAEVSTHTLPHCPAHQPARARPARSIFNRAMGTKWRAAKAGEQNLIPEYGGWPLRLGPGLRQ